MPGVHGGGTVQLGGVQGRRRELLVLGRGSREQLALDRRESQRLAHRLERAPVDRAGTEAPA